MVGQVGKLPLTRVKNANHVSSWEVLQCLVELFTLFFTDRSEFRLVITTFRLPINIRLRGKMNENGLLLGKVQNENK